MAGALLQLVDAGGRPPCADGTGRWTSEDRAERQSAAWPCEQYADELATKWGVWAGRDRSPKSGPRPPHRPIWEQTQHPCRIGSDPARTERTATMTDAIHPTLARIAQSIKDRRPEPEPDTGTGKRSAVDALRGFMRAEADPTTLVRRIHRDTSDQEN